MIRVVNLNSSVSKTKKISKPYVPTLWHNAIDEAQTNGANYKSVELAGFGPKEKGDPLGRKVDPDIPRVGLNKLELVYIVDPLVFNSINKTVQIIMRAGYNLEGESKVVAWFTKFLDSIGATGESLSWEELLTQTFKYQCIYGQHYWEKIFNIDGDKIVDLAGLDPKRMDYVENEANNYMLNQYGNPIGYVMKLKTDMEVVPGTNTDKPPLNAKVDGRTIFFKPYRIAHFKLYTVGDGLKPIGLIEPVFKSSTRKLNIEEGLANAIYRHGFPTMNVIVGDENHEPTPQQVDNLLNKVRGMDFATEIAHAFHNKIEYLEPKNVSELKTQFDYFIEVETAGLGIPKPFATGAGEKANRETLRVQAKLWALSLNDIIKNTLRIIEQKVFKHIAELEGFTSFPRIDWGEIEVEEIDAKAARLSGYAKVGLLDPDASVKHYIREIEGLPEVEEKTIKEEPNEKGE